MNNKSRNTDKKRVLGRKGITLAVCLLTVLAVSVGTTVAFISYSSDPTVTDFSVSAVDCEVKEHNGYYSVINCGDTDAYVRAAIIVTWRDDSGNIYGKSQPAVDSDYSIGMNLDDWFMGEDGYYYCVEPVGVGLETEPLIMGFTDISSEAPEGYKLSLEVIAAAIQSYPQNAVTENWGIAVDEDGYLGK